MNIIQSFYQIDKNICYFNNENNSKNDNYLINFYSLLLSFITLKQLNYNITIYCNSFAYEKIIKFIPYDNIIIDNINIDDYENEWVTMKLNVYERQTKPFIHIDGDVFLFQDLLADFINCKEYDIIVQSTEISNYIYGRFYRNNYSILSDYNLISNKNNEKIIEHHGGIGYNAGVIGFKDINFLEKYISYTKKLNNLINNGTLKNVYHQPMIVEQFSLFHSAQINNMNVYEILSYDDVIQNGENDVGNRIGYTHLLSGNKYVDYFVMLIRTKIFKNYPQYIKNVIAFESSIDDKYIEFFKHSDLDYFLN